MIQRITSIEALLSILKNHEHKNAPEWKRVVIFRQMRKLADA
jgi:hypothetical protein